MKASAAIPATVQQALKALRRSSWEAFLVGGCVRDWLLDKTPTDWDIATNAQPEKIQELFPDNVYKNRFGTVGVKTEDCGLLEVTTYRKEDTYSDSRHPDQIHFAKTLEEDLARRDFTINALALDPLTSAKKSSAPAVIDPFSGQQDLEQKIIRAVGDPQKRFREDALRLMRAVRFATQLNFEIEPQTLAAVKKNADRLQKISRERIRDELTKILLSPRPANGIDLLQKTGLLRFILPELEQGIGLGQNLHHIHTVYEHSLLSLKHCPSPKLAVRLAALLHDIAKPQTKRGEGKHSTFYNHDIVGARIVHRRLNQLRFPQEIIRQTTLLIRNHMFYYEVDTVTESSVRRLLSKIGPENVKDLIDLRIADRLGSGCPKAKPYKLRHLEYLIEKVSRDPISVKMLKVDGDSLHQKAGIAKGPKMGTILKILLSEVLEDPQRNSSAYLLRRARLLNQKDLSELQGQAEQKIAAKKNEEDRTIKRRHWVE